MRLQLNRARRTSLLGAHCASSLVASLLGLLTWACAEAPVAQPPEVDRARFEREVYPVLLRDCSFPACHGDSDRFFRVFGPGRTRLDPRTPIYEAPSDEEIDAAFDRSRSMLVGASEPSDAWLVRKPLETSAGGAPHMGRDSLGRDVYATRDEPGWRAIAAWAGVMLEAPTPDAGAAMDAGADDAGASDASTDDAGSDDAAVDAP